MARDVITTGFPWRTHRAIPSAIAGGTLPLPIAATTSPRAVARDASSSRASAPDQARTMSTGAISSSPRVAPMISRAESWEPLKLRDWIDVAVESHAQGYAPPDRVATSSRRSRAQDASREPRSRRRSALAAALPPAYRGIMWTREPIGLWSAGAPANRVVGVALVLAIAVGCRDGVSPWAAMRSPIVFANNTSGVGWDLYEVDFHGSRRRALAPGQSNDVMPSFAPDHREIAFFSDRSPVGLWVMGAEGESPRPLYATDWARADSKPAWSPDKRWIIVDQSSSMTRVEVATGEAASLGGGWAPSWSPDAELVAFNLFEGIALMTPDGANKRLIIPGAFDPAWSPDGRLIAYQRRSEDGTTSSI